MMIPLPAHLSGEGDSLTTELSNVSLGACDLADGSLTSVHPLGEVHQESQAELTVGKHARQTLLNELELGNWPAKLNSLKSVLERIFISTAGQTAAHPGNDQS